MTPSAEPDLVVTPSEELLLELLIARTRLGHTWWTVGDNRTSRRAAAKLVDVGLVETMHGVVYRTFRARLTESAIRRYMKNSYTPPILGGPL